MEWFERNYILLVDKNKDNYVKEGTDFHKQISAKKVADMKVFENGRIFDVLIPSITKPFKKIKREV